VSRREDLDRLVANHFPGARLSSFETLTGGVSADVTRLDMSMPDGKTRSVVLREHGARHDGHRLATEFAALEAVHSVGLAVPEPLVCDDSRSLLENPWLLMEYVEGSTEIPANEVGVRIVAMARHLFDISTTPIDQLPALPTILDPVPELLSWLPNEPLWDDLRATLMTLKDTAYRGKLALIHGDFWPQNILWDESGSIKAVIDWEDACIGDPNADVAFACLELRYLYGKEGEQRFKRAYSQYRAIEPFRFALWQAYAGTHAFQHMGNWGLEPEREKTMRQTAIETIREAMKVIAV
jgi:aminoglycoside phosphotransferase (APT) family kinase protein